MTRRRARPTLTPVELELGETFCFALRNGQTRRLKLLATHAAPLFSNTVEKNRLDPSPEGRFKGRTAYHFTADVEIDGHRMTLQRYVGVQEAFYEPYVVNGMRIFLDAVDDIFGFMTEDHGACRPGKAARFAVQDATLRICPERVHEWYPNPKRFIDMRGSYGGEDCWMGPYAGKDAHGGLDVDMPDGTPLFAPISFDDQYLADSVERGSGNNRWDAFKRWPDGSTWVCRVAHVARLNIKECAPVRGGAPIGLGAGMAVGYIDHSHFSFRIEENGGAIRLDPWILFWQAFEDSKRANRELRAGMIPPGPTRTGRRVRFRCTTPPRPGIAYYWTFGNGGFSAERNPAHVFTRPGIYPVTLTLDDGKSLSSSTCHMTVDGPRARHPGPAVFAPDDYSFRPRPAWVADTYGRTCPVRPHTVRFTAMSDGAIELYPHLWAKEKKAGPNPWVAAPRRISVRNLRGGRIGRPRIVYENGTGWLAAEPAGRNSLRLSVNPRGLAGGTYRARVETRAAGEIVSFRVELLATARSPFWHAIVDDRDPECYATPFFWVDLGLPAWWPKPGHGGRFLINGNRPRAGEFVRYTPFLWGGLYEVFLGKGAPFDPNSRFMARVRHARGLKKMRLAPGKSRRLGKFVFKHGAEGFVEIHAGGSHGQVVADAVFFKRLGDTPKRTWDHGMSRHRARQ